MRLKNKLLTGLITTLLATTTPIATAQIQPPNMSDVHTPIPDGGEPRPAVPMKQTAQCAKSGITKDINTQLESPVSKALNIPELHKYATGKGVTVAVIDSGVTPNPRLKNLKGGGDYVMGEDGLSDCDHHGTLIAGIIAAQPSPNDSFVGMAPDATIISIRQTSGAYGPARDEDKEKGTSTLSTLASGIVHAVNMGADVINMSVTSCYPADTIVDTSDLKAAINYAYQRGVVLVTAAGNVNGQTCTPNPGYDPAHGKDLRNWEGATTISMPSYYTPALISVGGTTPTMEPFLTTMAGPWVDIAAPATGIISLDPNGQGTLVNASPNQNGELIKLTGTSFSSAYITGLVALMLEKDPSLTPKEVEERLKAASRPGPDSLTNIFGAGAIDALGVLTTTGYATEQGQHSQEAEPKKDTIIPHITAIISTGIIATLSLILLAGLGTTQITNQINPQNKTSRKQK